MTSIQEQRRKQERDLVIQTILKTMARHEITIEELSSYTPIEEADKDTYQRVRHLHKPTRPPKASPEPVKILDLPKVTEQRKYSVRTL